MSYPSQSPSPSPSSSFYPSQSPMPGGVLQRYKKHNPILPFHKQMIKDLASPEEDDLLVIAKGLGLRRVITHLLSLYSSDRNLVLVINATPSDEAGLGEELGILHGKGSRGVGSLRVVDHELGGKARRQLYETGGIVSVTSRILVVDMLTKNIPIDHITGLFVLHADRVVQTSLEAFVIRLYRQQNLNGFLKAFSDEPESFTFGISPLQNVMKCLCLRRVSLWPRFHERVQQSLEVRKADVIELYQPMSVHMRQIQGAVVECMEATLSELKKSCQNIDLDDFTVENALFRNFDRVVRHQLDPVWHRVGNKTKKLVADLTQLRYLLSYDAVSFHSYLETIIASNSTAKGGAKQNQSPWLYLDAANTLFQSAKKRAYVTKPQTGQASAITSAAATEEEEGWEAIRETENGSTSTAGNGSSSRRGYQSATAGKWPEGIEPVLEELPKWGLLGEVLEEIESHIAYEPVDSVHPGANTVLVMCSGERTCAQLREYLSDIKPFIPGEVNEIDQAGKQMMERMLRTYFFWKNGLRDISQTFKRGSDEANGPASASTSSGIGNRGSGHGISFRNGQPPNKRRRVRASSTAASVADRNRQKARTGEDREIAIEVEMEEEAEGIADFMKASQRPRNTTQLEDDDDELRALADLPDETQQTLLIPSKQEALVADVFDDSAFDSFFGLIPAEDLVVVRPYSGDDDELILQEIRPRFIVMYDPDPAFIRRVEVYRSSNPGLGVRVYFMIYADSVEEQRYLSGLRKEKNAFERLIREKATMMIPINVHPRAPHHLESRARTVSSRNAGGSENVEQSRVIIDMREFRSTLPSILHAAGIEVIPATLQVGDYVITPTMCVERKSIPDLLQSFKSGRLFSQCEAMSIHYAQPILLIEFEQHKSFNLGTIVESRALTRPGSEKDQPPNKEAIDFTSIHSKLVLLTLSFPRLRIIWSSSTQSSVDIIADLKINHPQPDPAKAITIGGEEGDPADGDAETGRGSGVFNTGPEEMLRALPGITSRNYKLVASRVGSIKELCEVESVEKMQEIVGSADNGQALYKFLHKDSR